MKEYKVVKIAGSHWALKRTEKRINEIAKEGWDLFQVEGDSYFFIREV